MIPTCCIPLPLGYDIWSMERFHNAQTDQHHIQVLWTSPNGRPIYVRATADDEMLRTDEFWQTMLKHVQDYVRGTRTNINLSGEKNEQIPPVIEHTDYKRGPTTITPARVDSKAGGQRDVTEAGEVVR